MAYKDLRASMTNLIPSEPSAEEQLREQVERLFFEVALEQGLADAELLFSDAPREERYLVVYDKFNTKLQ